MRIRLLVLAATFGLPLASAQERAEPSVAARALRETVRKINPGWVHRGNYEINCMKTSLALEDTLAGRPTVALAKSGADVRPDLETMPKLKRWAQDHPYWYVDMQTHNLNTALFWANANPDRRLVPGSFADVKARLTALGHGARALVVSEWSRIGPPTEHTDHDSGAHAFNAMNVDGEVMILDGQKGLVASPEAYLPERRWANTIFMVTAPGGPSVLDTAAGRDMLERSFAGNSLPPPSPSEAATR